MDNNNEKSVFDATPHLKLFIDKEGRWFQNGAEIIHPQIYRLFCENLTKKPDGTYQLSLGREVCDVEVEDAPFVVLRIHKTEQGPITIELSDGTQEEFIPGNFWIGADNKPYCLVKEGRFHAGFSRPAYYQIAHYIEEAETTGEFIFNINGEKTSVDNTSKL